MDVEIVRKSVQKLESEVLEKIQSFEKNTGTFVCDCKLFFSKSEDGKRGTDGVSFGALVETPKRKE